MLPEWLVELPARLEEWAVVPRPEVLQLSLLQPLPLASSPSCKLSLLQPFPPVARMNRYWRCERVASAVRMG